MLAQGAVVMVVLLAAACSGSPGTKAKERSSGAATRTASGSPSGSPRTVDSQPAETKRNERLRATVDAALAKASLSTGVDKAALQVLSTEALTWPDGALGCPEPGVMYTMAPVAGFRIRIQVGAEILEYHASDRGHMVLCPAGRAIDPVDGAGRPMR